MFEIGDLVCTSQNCPPYKIMPIDQESRTEIVGIVIKIVNNSNYTNEPLFLIYWLRYSFVREWYFENEIELRR